MAPVGGVLHPGDDKNSLAPPRRKQAGVGGQVVVGEGQEVQARGLGGGQGLFQGGVAVGGAAGVHVQVSAEFHVTCLLCPGCFSGR